MEASDSQSVTTDTLRQETATSCRPGLTPTNRGSTSLASVDGVNPSSFYGWGHSLFPVVTGFSMLA
ncbi:hypothetical protein H634G_06837 [Metarhizium anisopliae BRIP 53293]|uniref:Uncharacterized protein n=1 Tax=Metarhizium anisopliae BRIP 53293 TaxID=1291518 RepID=A0A0D9NZ62_METAN|nr:hypothetical protein H634G_06837 [Metarhizium anisopliae BRIP 53293]